MRPAPTRAMPARSMLRPADREREIASDKDDAGRDAPAIDANLIVDRKQSEFQRGGDGYHDH